MKTVALDKADLNACVDQAQSQRVLLTRNGTPVALLIGVAGLHREQIELGTSADFWKLIQSRRLEKTISRSDVERRIRRKATRSRRS